jgi:hypothetical protein
MIQSQTGGPSEDGGAPWWSCLVRPIAIVAGCALAAGLFILTTQALRAQHAGFWTVMGAAAVYGVAILAVIDGANRFLRRNTSPARRRYERRLMAVMSVYVVALIAAIGAFQRLHPTGPLAWALAIAPALPVVSSIGVMGLYLREETDEFERAVVIQSSLWALGGLLAASTIWGFLELFDLVPHIQAWWAFPVWAVILGPAQFVIRRRYR